MCLTPERTCSEAAHIPEPRHSISTKLAKFTEHVRLTPERMRSQAERTHTHGTALVDGYRGYCTCAQIPLWIQNAFGIVLESRGFSNSKILLLDGNK